jgi:hypothetical protein
MQKKDLSKTYTKKIGVKQALEDMSRGPPTPISRPVSAGGMSAIPPTLSQEYLQFVLGIDEVPDWMRAKVWALITRMNNLTIIDGDFDFERMMHGVRAMLRSMHWERQITLLEMNEIEYYVGVQLRRSKSGKQLKYVSPGYQQILHQEGASSDSLVEERQNGNAAMGLLSKSNKRGGSF